MAAQVRFLQRTSESLATTERKPGQIIFVIDEKKIYLDTDNDRIEFTTSSDGGGGIGDIPIASKSSLGGVIPGDDFNIDAQGHLNLNTEKVLVPMDIALEETIEQDINEHLLGGNE